MDVEREIKPCVICFGPVEPWSGGGGYGHNPYPWPMESEDDRACNWCNENVVVPVRLKRVGALR